MAMTCAVRGSGNIGTDLMLKLRRSRDLELTAVVGIDPGSEGLARARALGLDTSAEDADWLVAHPDQAQLVFDATSASAHRANAPRLHAAGLRCLDLTPARLGPAVVPVVDAAAHLDAPELNLLTCGGQATIPMVAAVAAVAPVDYAEIVATIASASAGPGTRQNIDEFTVTTARGLEELGGARRGKAIIVLHPADPPLRMRNTVCCAVPAGADRDAIAASVAVMRERVAVAQDVVRPVIDRLPVVDRGSLLLGHAGVYSSFLLHAERAAAAFGVPVADVLLEAAARKAVGGQEDILIEIAAQLARTSPQEPARA